VATRHQVGAGQGDRPAGALIDDAHHAVLDPDRGRGDAVEQLVVGGAGGRAARSGAGKCPVGTAFAIADQGDARIDQRQLLDLEPAGRC
jgi:hypothetical protein